MSTEQYVTDEMVHKALAIYLGAPPQTGPKFVLRAALEAVAGDIAAAVRRECADEMRDRYESRVR